jgi:hypothetical protein
LRQVDGGWVASEQDTQESAQYIDELEKHIGRFAPQATIDEAEEFQCRSQHKNSKSSLPSRLISCISRLLFAWADPFVLEYLADFSAIRAKYPIPGIFSLEYSA